MRVLLIEDDALEAADIIAMLSGETGVCGVIKRVVSLAAARECLASDHFDVLLADLSLPDAAGSEIVQALTSTESSTPLIVLSDSDSIGLAVETVRLGAQDYLVKGLFTPEGITRSIRYAVERKQIERRLHYLSAFDQLTGLANRQQLCDVLRRATSTATRQDAVGALLFLDLDNFKFVNDMAGHEGGDALLRGVADRIRAVVRAGDTVARLGGDEFAVVLPRVNTGMDAEIVATKIVAELARPFEVLGSMYLVSASVGITLFPPDSPDATTLLRNADLAMYQAKRAGPGNIRFYTAELNKEALVRHDLERQLRQALDQQTLNLRYQPLVSLLNGALLGFEASIWLCPVGEPELPLDRLPPGMDHIAGLREAGVWAIRQACDDLAAWQADGPGLVSVRLPAFGSHWQHDGFVSDVATCIAEKQVPAELLRFQVPETFMQAGGKQFAERVMELGSLGIAVGLKDFSAAHCSLIDLANLPVDEVIMAPGMTAAMGDDRIVAAVVEAIVAVAQNAGKAAIASGVATRAQANRLRKAGCRAALGAHYGGPVAGGEAWALLHERSATGWPKLQLRTGTG